jgi:hypothetical protein
MKGRNSEGYADPTAAEAIGTVSNEERQVHTLMHLIRDVCNLAGFSVVGRIEFEHKASGRRYK